MVSIKPISIPYFDVPIIAHHTSQTFYYDGNNISALFKMAAANIVWLLNPGICYCEWEHEYYILFNFNYFKFK